MIDRVNTMRKKTEQHKYLESLEKYEPLTSEEKQLLRSEQNGWQGEWLFEETLRRLKKHEHIIAEDVQLEYEDQFFQIDYLLSDSRQLWIVEVKNYTANMIYTKTGWVTAFGKHTYHDPTAQTVRTVTLFRNFLRAHQFQLPVNGIIVFINDLMEVTLQESPVVPVLMKHQLRRFLTEWMSVDFYEKAPLIQLLHSERSEKVYPFKQRALEKLIPCCQKCGSRKIQMKHQICHCPCGKKYYKKQFLKFLMRDFLILFPKRPLNYSNFCKITGMKLRKNMFYEAKKLIQ